MPDLNFEIERADPLLYAAEPSIQFALRVVENRVPEAPPTPIHSVVLRCQIRIEPARRSYSPEEKARLLDLFGTPERWAHTLRPMLWTHVTCGVPAFEDSTVVPLHVVCSFDFNLAATKYFDAVESGDLPLCFLFSGTIFYEGEDAALQVTQISWSKEAQFRLPATSWQAMMNHYHPNTAWLGVRKDVFDRLDRYRMDHGLPTREQTLERLLAIAQESVTP